MRRKQRYVTRWIIFGVAWAMLLSACGTGGTSDTATTGVDETTTTTTQPPGTTSEPSEDMGDFSGVELELWRPNFDNAGVDAITQEFEELTGASIEVTMIPPTASDNVLPRWAAGERPDILYLEGFSSVIATLNPAENLQPLDGMTFTENIPPALEPFGVVNGVRYWAPLTAPTVNGLLYNKAVVENLDLTLPGTLDEMTDFCAAARSAGTTPVVIGEGSNFMAWVTQQAMLADYLVENPNLVDDLHAGQASFTDQGFVDRIQAVVDMKDADCFPENAEAIDFATSMDMFMADEGAIWNCATFCVPDILGAYGEDAVNEKVGFLPISYSDTSVWVYGADHWGVFLPVTGDTQREEAARAYVDYVTGEGYSTYLEETLEPSRYPNHPVPDPDALLEPVKESIAALDEYPSAAALDPRLICSFGDFFTLLSELFVGQKSAQEVAEAMQISFDQSCVDLGIRE